MSINAVTAKLTEQTEVSMPALYQFDKSQLDSYEADHDLDNEAAAQHARGDFIERFPRHSLNKLKLEDYVVGHQTPSFCNYVESRTQTWANIRGATASKFGVYFGRTKQDPQLRYHVTSRFGESVQDGFAAVKQALAELIRLGEEEKPDFARIDGNKLSQMFKAKILSLYYPERFLAICSDEALEEVAGKLDFPTGLFYSEIQNRLVALKDANARTRDWSYPKFARFIYDTYIRKFESKGTLRKPRKRVHRKVNFEDIQNERAQIGKKAEAFALKWEQERLRGAGLEHLIYRIDDRTDRPSYGYDFLSHSSEHQPRYIEVKAVSTDKGQHHFFLSENEYTVSQTPEHRNRYFFYLVSFRARSAVSLRVELASELYPKTAMSPASYTVSFDIQD